VAYYIDIFSPETYEAFITSPMDVSGLRERYENMAQRIRVGDKFICYITKISRWVGVLEVTSECFRDLTPRFASVDDPYIIRFKVKVLAFLPKEKAIPIKEENVWSCLSFTKIYDITSSKWTGKFRGGLNAISDSDGEFIEGLIYSQIGNGITYQIDEREYSKFFAHNIRGQEKLVPVSVPNEDDAKLKEILPQVEIRQSIKIQALLAEIGSRMGLKIWIPRNDRSAVLSAIKYDFNSLLDSLPLSYDDTTLRTVEQIDVLWLRGRCIIRAFEVEHTTAIYSGLLRMADLLALQPNMNIKLHIVAPAERRAKVFHEILRPVFSRLEAGPLADFCTYLSYESTEFLASEKHLSHLSDSVLNEYIEEAMYNKIEST
jgi:predicted RNA-binding protein